MRIRFQYQADIHSLLPSDIHIDLFRERRLQGRRRYDYKDVIGRVASGTETENDSGDKVDQDPGVDY